MTQGKTSVLTISEPHRIVGLDLGSADRHSIAMVITKYIPSITSTIGAEGWGSKKSFTKALWCKDDGRDDMSSPGCFLLQFPRPIHRSYKHHISLSPSSCKQAL